ncbi:MAG: rod shape-determining protein MreD, partial [Actinomycetota bacterium]|nr:rod shape-determining protein MreD [Actinomycetota bacterium]
MIRAIVIALLLFTAAVLQTALFPHITLAGFRPDLLLLTAVFALREGPLTGTAVGFGAGMLGDLLLAHPPLGLSGIVLLAVGYAVGVLRPYLAVGSVTPPL